MAFASVFTSYDIQLKLFLWLVVCLSGYTDKTFYSVQYLNWVLELKTHFSEKQTSETLVLKHPLEVKTVQNV